MSWPTGKLFDREDVFVKFWQFWTSRRSVPNCEICRILADPESGDQVIFTTWFWRVVLSPDQMYLGRAYVTLRQHRSSLSRLSLFQSWSLRRVVRKYERRVAETFGATLFNWACLMNDAVRAGQEPHVHLHVRPRYSRMPVLNIDGLTFEDPNYGYKETSDQREVSGGYAGRDRPRTTIEAALLVSACGPSGVRRAAELFN